MSVTTILPDVTCPTCKHTADAQSGVGDPNAVPQPGDWTICARCISLARFTDDLKLRSVTQEEIDQAEPGLRLMLCRAAGAITKIHKEKGIP